MPFNIRLAMGLGGVSPHDNHRAFLWEKRLHWPMLVVSLLAIPAFYLGELVAEPHLKTAGHMLDWVVLLAFSIELIVMLSVSTQRKRYVLHNWLSLAIIAATAVSLLVPHLPGELYALLRLLRLALAGLLGVRLAHQLRSLTPGSTPYILLLGFGLMLVSGAGFYWLEPTVNGYWDGVWLAFTSGLTVGYGDLVPTTHSSRLFASVVIVLTYGVMSLVTASIAAFFVGQEEKRMRLEMHHDLKALRQEIADLRTLFNVPQTKPPGDENRES
ncbi:MAG: potassium channel family protein [Thiobacillus sp.]|nr:potassium channel family protein [Thiobacillus sp.]